MLLLSIFIDFIIFGGLQWLHLITDPIIKAKGHSDKEIKIKIKIKLKAIPKFIINEGKCKGCGCKEVSKKDFSQCHVDSHMYCGFVAFLSIFSDMQIKLK